MRRVAGAIAIAVAACGGGDGAPAGTPSCAPGEVAWTGAFDGGLDTPLAYRFTNKLGAADGRLEVNYAEGRFVLEWQLLLANGAESPAQLAVDLSASGGPSFGVCLSTGVYPGTIHIDDSSSGWFAFRGDDLGSGPDGCGGPIAGLRGGLAGCFAAPPDDPR